MQLRTVIPLFLATLAAAVNTAQYNATVEAVKSAELSRGFHCFKQGDRFMFGNVNGKPGNLDFTGEIYQMLRIDGEKANDKRVKNWGIKWYCIGSTYNYERDLNGTLTPVEIHMRGTRLKVGSTTYSILRDDCGMKLANQFEEKPR
ncbi:hypothetical protein B0O99DRAFT_737245 [Bisporella sp. PMI_857]|nr:hypothetical protein B0O99DRAFT_737817 [Bisporella sp. PMI_857]KAH8600457.1 hypothetical protein B0O99DRAFT_737245 [Bisporella sp. PMI_857]